jgi:predicted aconitase
VSDRGPKLAEIEQAMRAGVFGPARRWAIEQQIRVGAFFDAQDFVEVSQAHLMADTESLGESGVIFLEELAALSPAERRVRVPTITDPRGIDFDAYRRLKQTERMAELERRTIAAFRAMGIMLTDTCINYQTVMPPARGEHLAFGDTGTTIYSNSVLGARTNFEGGPSALAAALTGRTPRYGYHLDAMRRATHAFRVDFEPGDLVAWGALGGIVGRALQSYWSVPLIDGLRRKPNSDELKHFGAALASFGTVALFHMPGITPEAPDRRAVFGGAEPREIVITSGDLDRFLDGYDAKGDKLDVVVFSAPQLSLFELERVAALLDARRIAATTSLLVVTSPENKIAAERHGFVATIERAGAMVIAGACFYQMHAREIGEANGWKRLMSNSAKLVNIIGGYGYRPTLGSMERCIDSAVAGIVL